MQLSFKKSSSFSSYEEGTIYFETSTHLIKVGTGSNSCEYYSGVRSAAWNSTTKVLTIVNQVGENIELNFADVASAEGVNSLLQTLRDDLNTKLAKPATNGTVGQVLRLKDSSGNTEWYSLPAATDYSIAIDSSEAGTQTGYLKSYHIAQNGVEIGIINIPKDLVVTSGSCVAGTWSNDVFTESSSGTGKAIKLVIANQTDPVYINVKDLVDVYTAQQNATQVQIAISNSNVISATIVNGSVTTDSLDSSVKTALGKANSAVQSVAAGTGNGTIKVDGTDVSVTGLKSAAYTESSAYATSAQGTKADSAIQSVSGETAVTNSSYVAVSVEASTNSSSKAVTLSSHANVTTHDVSTAVASTADGLALASDVKSYVDSTKEWKVFE